MPGEQNFFFIIICIIINCIQKKRRSRDEAMKAMEINT